MHANAIHRRAVSYDFATRIVNVIIVLGHERLYSDMLRMWKEKPHVSVVKLTKSGGVVERDRQYLTQLQRNKIHEYFYGTPKGDLSPYSMLVNFSDVTIWRAGEALAPSSALPLGMDSAVTETQLVKVDSYEMCLHSILAILSAESQESEGKLLESNIIGFIYVYVGIHGFNFSQSFVANYYKLYTI